MTIIRNRKRIQDEQIQNRVSREELGNKIMSKGHGQNQVPERKAQKPTPKAVILTTNQCRKTLALPEAKRE